MEDISFLLLSLPLSIVCSNVIISLDFRGVVLLLLCMLECGLSYPEVQGTSMGCFTDLTLEPAFHSNQINLSSFCPISSLYLCRRCCLHKRNAVLLLCINIKMRSEDVCTCSRFQIDMSQFPIIRRINEDLVKMEEFQRSDPSCQPDTP